MPVFTTQVADDPHNEARVAALFGEIEGAATQAYCVQRLLHPRYHPQLTRFIEIDGQVASAALLRHDRWLVDGAALDVGYVDNILTHPDYRHRGLFRALLNNSLQYLLDEGFALAALHGPVTLYAPFGFVPVRHHTEVTLPASLAAPLPPLGRARPLEDNDLPDLVALYAASYGFMVGSEERTEGVWRWLLPQLDHVTVIEDAARRVVAYARIDQTGAGNKLRVVEAAAADTQAALGLLAVLGAQAAVLPTANHPAPIYMPLPPEHPVAHAALLAGGEARTIGPLPDGSHKGHEDQAMALDLWAALSALQPAFARRLGCSIYAGWEGALGLETEEGLTVLEINRNGMSAGPLRGPVRGVAHLPAGLLAPLLLGAYGARDLSAWPGVRMPETLGGLLDVLFPVRRPNSENEDWWLLD